MWRLWLFLALIGLLIWGFARLQQRNGDGSNRGGQAIPPSDEADENGADQISKDDSADDR